MKLGSKFKKWTAIMLVVLISFTTFGCISEQTYLPSSDNAVVKYPEVTGYMYAPENPYQMDSPSDEYGRFQNSVRGTVTYENSNSFDTSMKNENFRVAIGYTPEGSDVTVNVDIGGSSQTVTLSDPDAFYNDYQNVVVNTGLNLEHVDDGDGQVEVTIKHSSSEKSVKIHEVAFIADQTSSTTSDDGGTTGGGTGDTGGTTSPSTGTVEFYTDPVGAAVYVDGDYKGQTSSYSYGVLTMELYEGSHSYTVSANDYETETGTFSVTAGETNAVTASLEESTSDGGGDDDGGDDGGDTEPSNTAPSAQISASQTSETNIVFTSESSDPDGQITKQEWFLNGEPVSTGDQYQMETSNMNSGTYVVELDVTDDQGATSTAKYKVTIDETKKVVESEEKSGDSGTDSEGDSRPRPVLQIPGFEAVFALAGLVIVVLLARRGER
ncbi:PEGA domain protein [Methanohalobium evestigatum Z-7303]|uniref:PEGA domain protein n=1 Tax=Methanohalobium evestigatum (strain ATCC BAA-1072 / DSM 3721 / NBRC 107634 / OCM 161 / Z-7303) TaxID=644295 RepID=D7E8I5_METEZ|nr:PEGA domain-containing protein [Methanohalobium evestigatum]ADI73527.1 PEGA domain protein [Methanohalobium evestigatum Z-7303]